MEGVGAGLQRGPSAAKLALRCVNIALRCIHVALTLHCVAFTFHCVALRCRASLAAKMLLRSAVLSQASGWRLWYEPLLRDLEHVVFVRPDLSDLLARLA